MKKTLFIGAFLVGSLIGLRAQNTSEGVATVDSKKVGYKTFNLQHRKEGDPVLVFEPGLGGGTFDPILALLPDTISGIQYERSGLGKSELDLGLTSDAQLVDRLHGLLVALKIKPPYLLVGHSIGGPYIRLFASKYPTEVSGLVFLDPTDFMLTADEDEKARIQSGSGTGYRKTFAAVLKAMSQNSNFGSGAHNDAKRAMASNGDGYFPEYANLPRLENIAVTVVISYNKYIEAPDEEMNKKLKLGIDFKPWWKQYDDLRISHYCDLIKDNDRSSIVLLPKYSHGLYYQDPKLIAKLVIENYNNAKKP
ncbi:alpha/beta hydrolase [Flavobacterium sp.]|uniref:alpha/beta fold hydrolase n=1 Tax=Flavobacterium sp. TaxID=239 RepID=UPI001201CFB4|nr:alpha/beta hydrolase [Flavobacterium sp.]RZJ69504.1 MAG: alpha/beta hydrolase [Flavobacterium sp.]